MEEYFETRTKFRIKHRSIYKDLAWVINQDEEEYKRWDRETFAPVEALPLEGFRWDDQLNVYRFQILDRMSYFFEDWRPSAHADYLSAQIISDKLYSIEQLSTCDLWQERREQMEQPWPERSTIDKLYLRARQLYDATMPEFSGDEPTRQALHYEARFMTYFLAYKDTLYSY